MSDGKQITRISQTMGKWIMIQYNEDAVIAFNGLPGTTKKEADLLSTPKIFMPEGALDKQVTTQQVEAVYEVMMIGEGALDATRDVHGNIIYPAIDLKVGDFVIAKGSVMKLFTVPTLIPVYKEHIVAKVNITL